MAGNACARISCYGMFTSCAIRFATSSWSPVTIITFHLCLFIIFCSTAQASGLGSSANEIMSRTVPSTAAMTVVWPWELRSRTVALTSSGIVTPHCYSSSAFPINNRCSLLCVLDCLRYYFCYSWVFGLAEDYGGGGGGWDVLLVLVIVVVSSLSSLLSVNEELVY